MKEFYREVGNLDPVDVSLAVCDDTTDALIESYKKADSLQIKRQILSVLSVSRTYHEMKILLPDVTEYRYYIAKKHANFEGCCLPPPEKDDVRQRMDPAKLDNFLHHIFSHSERPTIWAEENSDIKGKDNRDTKHYQVHDTTSNY